MVFFYIFYKKEVAATMAGKKNAVVNGKKFEKMNDFEINFTNSSFLKTNISNVTYFNKISKARNYYVLSVASNNGKILGYSFNQYRLYRFFELDKKTKGIFRWEKYISKMLLPDDCFFNVITNELFVIEKKYQAGKGSVDEKLQTFDFKRKEYLKLLKEIVPGIKIHYWYILNKSYYSKNEFKDIREYILDNGSKFFYVSNALEARIVFDKMLHYMNLITFPRYVLQRKCLKNKRLRVYLLKNKI